MDIHHEQFINNLRSALHYLYDPDQLRRSPLVDIFGLSNRVDASSAVQKILLDGIEALRPPEDEPPQSRGWMVYEVLFFRYVRGYDRLAVANQLGISERQLSREQRTAIEALGMYLWENCREEKDSGGEDGGEPSAAVDGGEQAAATFFPVREIQPPTGGKDSAGQLSIPGAPASDWMDDLPPEKPAAWKGLFLAVLDLVRPLAEKHDVHIRCEPDENIPDMLVPQHAARHALLNILSVLVPAVRQGSVEIDIASSGLFIQVLIQANSTPGLLPVPFDQNHASLLMAGELVERSGGRLVVEADGREINISLDLPTLRQISVMVVDDNVDVVHLFQRYAQGSRYAVVGVQNPLEASRTAQMVQPRAIFLDVMMPDLDGWELLRQLRWENPDSVFIICSILPQESLARSLGADAFLRKPVLPDDFLNLLDQLVTEPRER